MRPQILTVRAQAPATSPRKFQVMRKDGLVLPAGQVFGLMDGRTERRVRLSTSRRFPIRKDQCCWRGSFPNTAAGQRRNWTFAESAPASLLIPSLYLHKAMETLACANYAAGGGASSHALETD